MPARAPSPRHGYIGIYLDIEGVDWEEVRELLADGYRIAAPKKVVKELAEPKQEG